MNFILTSSFALKSFLVIIFSFLATSVYAIQFFIPTNDEDGNFLIQWQGNAYQKLYEIKDSGSELFLKENYGTQTQNFNVFNKSPGVYKYKLINCTAISQYSGPTNCTSYLEFIQVFKFDSALWRLVSRTDRYTLGLTNSGNLVSRIYSASNHQHWRILRNGENFQLKNHFNGFCLSTSGSAIQLGSCSLTAANLNIELLRPQTVSKPAIYYIRLSDNKCIRPTYMSTPSIGLCDDFARWYIESAGFGERRNNTEYEVKGLLIVKPTTDFNNPNNGFSVKGRIPQSIVDASKISFISNVGTLFEHLTDGRVKWTGDTVTAIEPIRSLSYNKTWWRDLITNQYMVWNSQLQRFEPAPNFSSTDIPPTNFTPLPSDVPNDVQRFIPRGIYDTAMIFFTGGNAPGGWGWGPGISKQSNFTAWTTINGGAMNADAWLSSNIEPSIVFIHELMHGYDSHYDQFGLPLPEGNVAMGLEGYVHGGEANLYSKSSEVGDMHWYRDYWLGKIIASDDTYRGYGTKMFSMPTIRQYALGQPESSLKIIQSSSGKCLAPSISSPSANTAVVLTSACSSEASSFVLQSNGILRHKASGLCVHPKGGTAVNGVSLVLWPSCSYHINFPVQITDQGSIKNTQSGLCVHPQGGASNPAEGTPVVYWSGCDEYRLQFKFNIL